MLDDGLAQSRAPLTGAGFGFGGIPVRVVMAVRRMGDGACGRLMAPVLMTGPTRGLGPIARVTMMV